MDLLKKLIKLKNLIKIESKDIKLLEVQYRYYLSKYENESNTLMVDVVGSGSFIETYFEDPLSNLEDDWEIVEETTPLQLFLGFFILTHWYHLVVFSPSTKTPILQELCEVLPNDEYIEEYDWPPRIYNFIHKYQLGYDVDLNWFWGG